VFKNLESKPVSSISTTIELKKQALIEIINDYNALFNTNHSIAQFDSYYQDIQTRIKDQKYTNQDLRAMASSTALCCERKSKILPYGLVSFNTLLVRENA
jgi:type I restriction enzyme R subunit